jgi:hypothetical protein
MLTAWLIVIGVLCTRGRDAVAVATYILEDSAGLANHPHDFGEARGDCR